MSQKLINMKNTIPASKPYQSVLSLDNMETLGATISVSNVAYTPIARIRVKADEFIGIGFGALMAQNTATGRIFAKIADSTGDLIKGKLRIFALNSELQPLSASPIIFEADISRLAMGENDFAERTVLPFLNAWYSKDRIIQFEVLGYGDTAQTITMSQCSLQADISRATVTS